MILGNLYISKPLQSAGFGNAAISAAEAIAEAPPLSAGAILLFTVAKEAQKDVARYNALRSGAIPKVGCERCRGFQGVAKCAGQFTLQEWYERRGYVVYETHEGKWDETDATGKVWKADGVGMRLDLTEVKQKRAQTGHTVSN